MGEGIGLFQLHNFIFVCWFPTVSNRLIRNTYVKNIFVKHLSSQGGKFPLCLDQGFISLNSGTSVTAGRLKIRDIIYEKVQRAEAILERDMTLLLEASLFAEGF